MPEVSDFSHPPTLEEREALESSKGFRVCHGKANERDSDSTTMLMKKIACIDLS